MKEPYRKGVANHPGPESCAEHRKVTGEALTGESAGQPLSCENRSSRVPTPLSDAEGNTSAANKSKATSDSAQSETLGMRGHSLHGSREIPAASANRKADRAGKVTNQTPATHAAGKSDGRVVPRKRSNKGAQDRAPAEGVEGRRPTEGNAQRTTTLRTQSRDGVTSGLNRVRAVAREDKRKQFTALLHHITVDLLRESFLALKRQAAPGVDGMTWQQYETHLETRLCELHEKVHRGTYRAQPSKRTYIPKADGKQRPLGIAALEDKTVQQAVDSVLNHVYEEDFLGFSYGFRPGRSQHQALDALWVGLMGRKVNWVLDADIRGFFDTIDHEWMRKFIAHRIGDRRILRLIHKWLKAGVSEDGRWTETNVGTPQGAVISPLLANVYMHYVFDLWAQHWRKTSATGDVIIVRYADDFVVGFQYRHEAERFLNELQERFRKFGLALHPDKTRLFEFGRFAAENRTKRGERKPETFNFLGFTHICGRKHWSGGFIVKRQTIAKRMTAKLKEVSEALMCRRHEPVAKLGLWLGRVVQGYLNYHAVPGNMPRLEAFRTEAIRAWFRALKRRSQRSRITWERFAHVVSRWIAPACIRHPYPNERFYATHPK